MLSGSQNGQSKPLLASHTICGTQHRLSETLQASYTLCDSQNGLSEPVQAQCTSFAVLKTDLPNLYRPFTRFAVERTLRTTTWKLCGTQNRLYEPLRFCYKVCDSQNGLRTSTGLLHALWQSKRILRTCTGLLSFATLKTDSLNLYVQASYTLCRSQNGLSEPLQAFSAKLLAGLYRF